MMLPDASPVVIGVGQVNSDAPWEAQREPIELASEALGAALADTHGDASAIAGAIDVMGAAHIISWRYRDPARLVAERAGLRVARTEYATTGGNTPQMLVNRYARKIAAGDISVGVVFGAESWRTRIATKRAGQRVAWTVQPDDVEPDEQVGGELLLNHPSEVERGLSDTGQIYALVETAIRHREGESPAAHALRISRMWARFSEIAAANPHARVRTSFTPEQVATPIGPNRYISYPYPLRMNANAGVDQAAAIIVCSRQAARAFGVPDEQVVYLRSAADGFDPPALSMRDRLDESPAIRIAGGACLTEAEVEPADVTYVDLYSCYPSAVQIAARELGLPPDRDLTVTGGLSFAGGPWNNYVSHAIATMVEKVRAEPGSTGLCSGNGGALAKHAFGLYSTDPPPSGMRYASPQAEIDACGRREPAPGHHGPMHIEGYCVDHDRENRPVRAIAGGLTARGARAWAHSTDPAVMERLMADDVVGDEAQVDGSGAFTLG